MAHPLPVFDFPLAKNATNLCETLLRQDPTNLNTKIITVTNYSNITNSNISHTVLLLFIASHSTYFS